MILFVGPSVKCLPIYPSSPGTHHAPWLRHSFCSRLLASMMPANMYAKNKVVDKTMDSMNKFMAENLTECFFDGVEATLAILANILTPKLIFDGHFIVFFFGGGARAI